jgi:Flp pilus assembly protein TadG
VARFRRRYDDGAAAVEFALVFPLLALLVFGIIQFGISFSGLLALNNASRQGARVGAVGLNTCATVMGQVYQGSQDALGVVYPVTVTVSRSGGAGNLCVATLNSSGSATYSTGSATVVACPSGNVANRLNVKTTTTGSFVIPPFFFVSNYSIAGKGVYQCEIS